MNFGPLDFIKLNQRPLHSYMDTFERGSRSRDRITVGRLFCFMCVSLRGREKQTETPVMSSLEYSEGLLKLKKKDGGRSAPPLFKRPCFRQFVLIFDAKRKKARLFVRKLKADL